MSAIPESFICDRCKEEYEVEGDMADAMREANEQYPGIWEGKWGKVDKVCSSCYHQIKTAERG